MAESLLKRGEGCFYELDPSSSLFRRSFGETMGTALLTVAMVAAGQIVRLHAAQELLLASLLMATAIAGALVGLIVALGKVSGGHFNPLITISQWLGGERGFACTAAYVLGQLAGAVVGAAAADLLFARQYSSAVAPLTIELLLSEAVASFGLLTVVLGCSRSAKRETGPFAVGAWLAAAIVATPSASYANPAVTIAAVFATGTVALHPLSAGGFVVAQLVGMLLAIGVNKIIFGRTSATNLPAASQPIAKDGLL